MNSRKKLKEIPVTPATPEIKPGKDLPEPVIQPEHPPKLVPIEKPQPGEPPPTKIMPEENKP